MPAALQLAVVVTVTTATVQEELIDAPVLYLLTVWETSVKSRSFEHQLQSSRALDYEMKSENDNELYPKSHQNYEKENGLNGRNLFILSF